MVSFGWGAVCFRGGTLFDNPAETGPLLELVVEEETVAATCGAEVAVDEFGTVVGCEFGEGFLGWRCVEW